MFVSFTDWEFDENVENSVECIKGFWPEMQNYSAADIASVLDIYKGKIPTRLINK